MAGVEMRKRAIFLCFVMALSSSSFGAVSVATLDRMLTYLSRSIGELKALAAGARAATAEARDAIKLRGQAEFIKLKPVFQDAKREADRLEQQALIEKWRERTDRISDTFEVFKKVEELKQLEVEGELLKNEFCGPRDMYRFSGDC